MCRRMGGADDPKRYHSKAFVFVINGNTTNPNRLPLLMSDRRAHLGVAGFEVPANGRFSTAR
jgi:hypothetical protein